MFGLIAAGIASAVAGAGASRAFSKSGGQLGREQRAYMDNAYPELNQWEQAGAGQSGAASEQEVASKQNRVAFAQMGMQAKMQADTNASNERIAMIQTGSAEGIAGAQLQQQQPLIDAQVQTEMQKAGLTETQINEVNTRIDHELKKMGLTDAQIKNAMQDLWNKKHTQSVVGKIAGDVVNVGKGAIVEGEQMMDSFVDWIKRQVQTDIDRFKGVFGTGNNTPANKGGRMNRKSN